MIKTPLYSHFMAFSLPRGHIKMVRILLIILGTAYALSPYDILPDMIFGWGWIDDLVAIYLLWRYLSAQGRKKKTDYRRFYKQQEYYRQQFKSRGPGEKREETSKTGHKDPYSVLGIPPSASKEDIKKAYRSLAAKYHPDKVEHLGEEFKLLAETRFKEIQRAYDLLMKES